MTRTIIQFKNVQKKFGHHPVIPNLSFSIQEGEFVTVLGSSGSGKTTTLKMINGLEKPSRGQIEVNGHNLSQTNLVSLRRHIGYVVQSIGLFPHMTIDQNIAVTPTLLKWDKERIKQRVTALLKLVNLPLSFKDRYPAQLFGGQQQRVGVARALATNPSLLLFDEPFSALDAITRQDLQKELKKLHQDLAAKTFFFVTHDINEALFLGDRVMIMNEGRLQQFAPPQTIVNKPATEYVAQLLATEKQNQSRWEEWQ